MEKMVYANVWIHTVTRQLSDIENLWKHCAYGKPIFTSNIIEKLTHKWTNKRPRGQNAEKVVAAPYWAEQGKEVIRKEVAV